MCSWLIKGPAPAPHPHAHLHHARSPRRYAGHAFEREEEAAAPGGGTLIVKGLKSMWRQAAPIVRTTLHGALERILMRDDVRCV